MTKRQIVSTVVSSLLTLMIGILAAWFGFLYIPIVRDPQGLQYTVKEGASFQSVIQNLHYQHIIKHPYLFSLLVRIKDRKHQLKAGEYLFPKGSTPLTMLDQMVTGKGLVYHPFTIIAGWNIRQVREALKREGMLTQTVQQLSDGELMARLGYANLPIEGQFFPDTYYYTAGSSDIKLLGRAFKAMQEKLNKAWLQRAPGLPYKDAYTALIAASLVEKEAHFDVERPEIAGVLLNRLNHDMLLQIDASVIYGLGSSYDGKIYKTDLHKDTPYNTYLHKGLPPTPISMPGLSSINAVMHPSSNDYFYYVARGDGYHQFSKSLIEHNQAIAVAREVKPAFFNSEKMKAHLQNVMRKTP